MPRCVKWATQACIDHFDLIDCTAAFQFCAEETMGVYQRESGMNLSVFRLLADDG